MATKYRVQGPDGAVHIFEGPDDATPAQVETFAAQTFGKTPVAQSGIPGPRQEPTMAERVMGLPATRFALGAATPIVGAFQVGANVGDVIAKKMGMTPTLGKDVAEWWNTVQSMKEKGMATPEQQLLGVSAPWDIAGLAGTVATGMGGVSQAKNLGAKTLEGMKLGTVFGAAQPGASDLKENVTGAALGATLGAALPAVIPAAAKAAGWVTDVATGQLTKVKAADIARKAAGDQINTIRAALSAAPGDINPAQATFGIDRNAWQALNKLANQTDENSVLLRHQYENKLAELAQMAQGGNATEARAAQEASKRILNEITGGMRTTELGAANQAAATLNQLSPKLQQRQASMVNALREGMPMGEPLPGQATVHPGTEAAQAKVRFGEGKPGWISNADRSQEWQQASDTFKQIADQRRSESGFIERQIGSLEAHGLKPLDAQPIIDSLNQTMNAPGTRASPTLVKVLDAVKNDIAELTARNGGIIDAYDLYTLRKEGLNERISQLLGPTDPKTSSKLTADVLGKVKPLIDDAIEKAGGTGWKDYLSTYSQGMHSIDQKAMAAEAMRLFKDAPDQYVKLVRGNNTDAVEAIFGKGNYNIFKEMSSKMPTLEKIASSIERDTSIEQAATKGTSELARIISPEGLKLRLPFMGKMTSLANMTIADLEKRVGASTMEKLRKGMATNQNVLDLLDTLPTVEKNKVLKAIIDKSSPTNKAVTKATISAATNALAPKSKSRNALAESP